MTDPTARWIVDGPSSAAWNMGFDEALLDGCASAPETTSPALRFYSWSPPTLSLGRNQSASRSYDAAALARRGWSLVRRPTGGSAVLHHCERTVSVCAAIGRDPFPGGVLDCYRRVAAALADGLARVGIRVDVRRAARSGTAGASCFDSLSHHEISVGGRKLVGAAQLRRRGAFLIHASIPLRLHAEELQDVLGAPVDASRFTDTWRAGRVDDTRRLDAELRAALERHLGLRLHRWEADAGTVQRARELAREKYGDDRWTFRC